MGGEFLLVPFETKPATTPDYTGEPPASNLGGAVVLPEIVRGYLDVFEGRSHLPIPRRGSAPQVIFTPPIYSSTKIV